MPRTIRVGAQFDVADPFWVLVREAVYQRTRQRGIEIIPIDVDSPYLYALSNDEQISLIEELQVQEIDALICQGWPESLATHLLDVGVPVINLTESDFRHL